jgi:ribonuclease D
MDKKHFRRNEPAPVQVHKGDIKILDFKPWSIAVDTEAMGLLPYRDRLCVVQLSTGDGSAHVVQLNKDCNAPNLIKLLEDDSIQKLFHYARFDMMMIRKYLNVKMKNVYCTKIASRLARTFTDKHGLKELVREFVGVEISKHEQTSDWGSDNLTPEQIRYAASDVLHLHKIRDALQKILDRENRSELAKACFEFLPTKIEMDLMGMEMYDIFAYQTRIS